MKFNATPEDISQRDDLSLAEKVVAGCIWRRTVLSNNHGFELVRREWICEAWALNPGTVTDAIRHLVEIGVVECRRTRAGNVYKWTAERNVTPDQIEKTEKPTSEIEMSEIPICDVGKTDIKKSEKPTCDVGKTDFHISDGFSDGFPNGNTHKTACAHTDENSPPGLEPFESGLGDETAVARLGAAPKPVPEKYLGLTGMIGPNAYRWVQMMINTGTDPDDWRLMETLELVAGKDIVDPGSNYFRTIYKGLKEQRPDVRPQAPKTYTSKFTGNERVICPDGQFRDKARPGENGSGRDARDIINERHDRANAARNRPLAGVLGGGTVDSTNPAPKTQPDANTAAQMADRLAAERADHEAKAEQQRREMRRVNVISAHASKLWPKQIANLDEALKEAERAWDAGEIQ